MVWLPRSVAALSAGPIYQAALEPGGRLLNYAIGALPLSVAG